VRARSPPARLRRADAVTRVIFRSPPWDSVVYWSLDLETGGLDSKKDPILAVGMVPIRGGTIRLGESWRTLVRPERGSAITPGSVQAHQLVWSELQAAPPLGRVLPQIESRLREGVLLVHYGALDVTFLKRDFDLKRVAWPDPKVVDTKRLLLRNAQLRNPELTRDLVTLNLSRARSEYGLPDYQAHDALTDAVATAELFLALRAAVGARTLRDLR
jgi:DNA polymerase III subunit epsilon